MKSIIKCLSVAGLILFIACSTNPNSQSNNTTGDTASDTISAVNGGTITSSDGKMTLTFPPGALDADTEISITVDDSESMTVYDMQPSGLAFNTPVTATYQIDLADIPNIVDENGAPLDTTERMTEGLMFLLNDDDTIEALATSTVTSAGDSTVMTVTTELSHFTGLIGTAGNGMYTYMSSLGTHYVGSSFKRDATLRYLGYSGTSSYQNMSITYQLKSVSVSQFTIDVSGAIARFSPSPLSRSDFMSMRGQEAATRPKFNCKEVGSGTATFTATGTAVVEATFQPENKTLNYTVNFSETTTRNGKCIASVSQDFNQSDAEETAFAMTDPQDDTLVDEGGLLVSADGFDVPAAIDLSGSLVSIIGDEGEEALLGAIDLYSNVPETLDGNTTFLSYDFLVLDESVGDTGFPTFEDALWDLSYDGTGSGNALSPVVYHWNGAMHVEEMGLGLEFYREDNFMVFVIPLADLGMSVADINNASFRAVTSIFDTSTGGTLNFVDTVDLGTL